MPTRLQVSFLFLDPHSIEFRKIIVGWNILPFCAQDSILNAECWLFIKTRLVLLLSTHPGQLWNTGVNHHYFLWPFFWQIREVLGQNGQLQKYFSWKSDEINVVSKFVTFLSKEGLKLYAKTVGFYIFYFLFNCPFMSHLTVHSQELAGGGSMAVTVGISDMWQVTGDTQHMTPDTWHLTPDLKNKFIYFFGIGATICTHQEIQCLLCAGFLWGVTSFSLG